jgi:KDO2-lipid IV(A) lauroyltransferase
MLTYYLVVPFIYLFAYLPSPVLYKLADVLAFFLRSVFKYRKQVVINNLRNSFPEKSEAEIKQIAKQSYTHLADRVVENIKCLTIKPEEYLSRCTVENIELLTELYNQKKSVVLMLPHINCWEYAGYVAHTLTKFTIYGVYSPAKNKYFNNLIVRTRTKLGMNLISMKDTFAYFKNKPKEVTFHVFVSDQSPSNPQKAYWTKFLHQDTAFFYGGARYAVKHNCIPVYAKIIQIKRGYYRAYLSKIKEDVTNCTPDDIVQGFAEKLEAQLKEHPAHWLWSHKRWKHKKISKP